MWGRTWRYHGEDGRGGPAGGQRQSDGRSEIITLITLVLWTERAGRDGKSKAGQAEPPIDATL